MTYDDWKTTEPDRGTARDAHRPGDEDCECVDCRYFEDHDDGPCSHVYNGDRCERCDAEYPQTLREHIEANT